MRINHNIAALNTLRQLGNNTTGSSKNLEKLSSGLRINRAGDDAAGLAISEKMRAQIRGLDMASKNAQDSISLIQTAEGAMNETHSILQRMRELAVQSSNDTNTVEDREKLQKEIDQLTSEINRIGKTTQFNNKNLLNGDLSSKYVAAGTPETHVVKAVDAEVDVNFATGVTYNNVSTTGTKPADFKVTVAADDGALFNWDAIDDGATNTITVTKTTAGLKVEIAADDGTDSLDVEADLVANSDGSYSYNAHGVSFTLSKADYDGMGATDTVVVDLSAIATAATDTDVSGTYGTKSNYTTATDGSSAVTLTNGVNVIDDFKVDDALTNVANVTIAFDGTDLVVSLKDKAGADVAKTTITTVTPGTAYTFDNYGVSFTINDQLDAADDFIASIDLTTKNVDTTATVDKSLTFQIGSNEHQTMSLAIEDIQAKALGLVGSGTGFSATETVTDGTNNKAIEKSLDIVSNAANAITVIDAAINTVSDERSKLGAVQNRLEHTINNLSTSSENLTAAESRIRDVDMAKEMMEFTKNNILTQAAQAMLAQANQQPQGVLQLLR
ncbi:MAG: hypothetical protein K0R57_4338 [Paenibacillaceae bacterium]|jgi:flagellin|nr:hypothetical protein [Paenibacillaceae bacterium]